MSTWGIIKKFRKPRFPKNIKKVSTLKTFRAQENITLQFLTGKTATQQENNFNRLVKLSYSSNKMI